MAVFGGNPANLKDDVWAQRVGQAQFVIHHFAESIFGKQT